MRLLLDQNLSRRLLPQLETYFPGSSQVALLGMECADDRAIWEYARRNGYALVTKDSDFHELSLIYGAPPKVVWLKCGNSSTHTVSTLLVKHHRAILDFLADDSVSCLEVYG